MATKTVIPIRSSTQKFIEIEEIRDNIVMFTDGSCALIITTTAVNFGLLSYEEQEAIIFAYAGLINSLSFPIQMVIRTQHKDISSYLNLLKDQEGKQTNQKLKNSITSYRAFIETMVKEKEVLDKKFYIIIPFSTLELGPSTKTLLSTSKKGLPYPKDYIFERAAMVLTPKRDHMLRLLSRLGLRATQLKTEQIIRLFFNIYNPGGTIPLNFESSVTGLVENKKQ